MAWSRARDEPILEPAMAKFKDTCMHHPILMCNHISNHKKQIVMNTISHGCCLDFFNK